MRSKADAPELGIGCNNFGSFADERAADQVVSAALDYGVNYFDTADAYPPDSPGTSEQILGAALKDRRDQAVIATKFGYNFGSPHGRADAAYIKSSVNASLARLGTDYIDVYQLHRPSATPVDETLSALEDLIREGKVRGIGCCNFTVDDVFEGEKVAQAMGLPRLATNQISMSVLAPNTEVQKACVASGVGVIPYFVLGSGLLTGKYRLNSLPSAATRLMVVSHDPIQRRFADVWPVEMYLPVVEQLAQYAEVRGHTLTELAFGWICRKPAVSTVLAGATSADQVTANVRAFDAWRPDDSEMEQIEDIARLYGPPARTVPPDSVPEFSRQARTKVQGSQPSDA